MAHVVVTTIIKDHRHRLHRGSGKIALVLAEQPGQMYHFTRYYYAPDL